MESIIDRIKKNLPDIKKTIFLDDNKEIAVQAELYDSRVLGASTEAGPYTIIYDIKSSEPDGSGGLIIPFTVNSREDNSSVRDRLSWKPKKDNTGILLGFDDRFTETWENYFYLFDQHRAKVTFFIQGEISPFCEAALKRGHDVGYHTINHLNPTKISRDTFLEEATSEIWIFRSHGIPLTSFAYPFGLSEDWMNEELLKYFKILRGYGVTFRVYTREALQQGYVTSKALDNILFKEDGEFTAIIDLMLRAVKFAEADLILPLATHDISDTADWGIKPGRLKYLLQTANDLQLNFYRYKDL